MGSDFNAIYLGVPRWEQNCIDRPWRCLARPGLGLPGQMGSTCSLPLSGPVWPDTHLLGLAGLGCRVSGWVAQGLERSHLAR